MSLEKYNEKRDFRKTKEPKGTKKSSSDSLVFVVQKHEASRLHYDFRLEWDGTLLSWAVPKGPSYSTKDKRLAVETEPHPYDYKEFEGTIPKGEYGGGTVMLWDEGTWEPQEGEDVAKGLKSGSLKFVLHGERLKGKWTLVRMKPKAGEKQNNWLLIKEKDDFTQTSAGIDEYTTSVRTGLSMEEIESGQEDDAAIDTSYDVQLATLRKTIPTGEHWMYEMKYDGYRMLAYLNGETVQLITRNHQDYTDKFPGIVNELKSWNATGVLDGEIVVNKEGRSHFQSLQHYVKEKKGPQPIFMVFDLLSWDGEELVDLPLSKRRSALEKHISKKGTFVHLSQGTDDGEALFSAACDKQMEGILCKRTDKAYVQGRSSHWVKVKCEQREGFVVIGYTQTEQRTRAFSSLLLGVEKENEIVYAGRVGTGFTDASAKELHKKMKPLERKTPPIDDVPNPRRGETNTWVKPEIRVDVRYAEWTNEGLLRQASFKGVLDEKKKKEINDPPKETVVVKKKRQTKAGKEMGDVRLTSPEKEMFKGISKEDVAQYYEKIAPKMLPFIQERLLSLVRCPDGVSGDCFYQKHAMDNFVHLKEKTIQEKEGDNPAIYLKDSDGLLEAVQYGTLEFHTWGSPMKTMEKPDWLVFDLDPDEGMDIGNVRQGVRDLKSILDELGLEAFLKTSGGKGYHVVVPITPTVTWDKAKEFSKNVAQVMEQKWPKKYTSNVRKEKRKGKIFIDWMRNGRGSTSVSPYSLRAKETATVSAPIAWDELSTVEPADYTMDKMLRRRKDPWADFFSVKQSIGKSTKKDGA